MAGLGGFGQAAFIAVGFVLQRQIIFRAHSLAGAGSKNSPASGTYQGTFEKQKVARLGAGFCCSEQAIINWGRPQFRGVNGEGEQRERRCEKQMDGD